MWSRIKQQFTQEFSFFMMTPALVWQFLFFIVPLLLIVITSVVDYETVLRFTLMHYYSVADKIHLKIIGYSLLMALSSAFSCLLVAYPIAYFVAIKARSYKNFLLFFLIVPFWTNILVLVYSWLFILERDGFLNKLLLESGLVVEPLQLLNTPWAIGLVLFYCYLPFMIMPIFTALEKLDVSLLEASLDLGATYWQTLHKIILPLSWPGIKTGFFLVFVISFGEFIIPFLMGGDKYMVVGTAISHYVLTALDLSRGAAFICFSGLFIAASILILHWSLKRLILRNR